MIRVEHLYHSYAQNDQYQVRDVSFNIAQGEIFGFLGPSGAGKSTTQKVLTGLLPLQKGHVSIAGVEIGKAGRALFNQIGVSFEQPNLYKKLTALENLEFFRGLFDGPTADPRQLLVRLGLGDSLTKRAGAYSKGMQQRLVLARSLVNNPRIWFLDEPTSGLDPTTSQTVKELIREKQNEGTTIFLTTHNMQVAEELCDRVAFINNGVIAAMDSPRNLKLKYGEQMVKVEHRTGGRLTVERLSLAKPEDRKRVYDLMESGAVETVHSQEATLEEIFIAVTGRGLS